MRTAITSGSIAATGAPIRHFVLFRAGLSGAGAVRTARAPDAVSVHFAIPVLFAATVHLRRKLRTI